MFHLVILVKVSSMRVIFSVIVCKKKIRCLAGFLISLAPDAKHDFKAILLNSFLYLFYFHSNVDSLKFKMT